MLHVESEPIRKAIYSRSGRRRKIAVFLSAVIMALLIIGYATLPWWIPTKYIAEKLADDIARQVALPATIESLNISWTEGITITGLHIGRKEGLARREMLSIGQIRLEFSPIRLLLGKTIARLELKDVQLNAIIRKDGLPNFSALDPLIKKGPAPERLIIRQARCLVQFPDGDKLMRLDISDLQYRQGRLRKIGQITMSALLEQKGDPAPITLDALAGTDNDRQSVLSTTFRFNRVDVDQLGLPKLLGMPLEYLKGRAGGQMDCLVDDNGFIKQFSLLVYVDNLQAKPVGAAPLPPIRKAEISLSGNGDPINKSVELHGFHLCLPGLDLKGAGRVHTDLLAGQWKAVHHLEITGLVNPAVVAQMFSGKEAILPGDTKVKGNIEIQQLTLRGNESQMSFSIRFDATKADMLMGNYMSKPAGRILLAAVDGNLENRTWKLIIDQARLQIGANRFSASGSIGNIQRLFEKSSPGEKDITKIPREIITETAWKGRWEITDLNSINEILIGLSEKHETILKDVQLSGVISGRWSIEQTSTARDSTTPDTINQTSASVPIRIRLQDVHLPEKTRLLVGNFFVKPRNKPIDAELSCDVLTASASLRRIHLQVSVGDGSIDIESDRLTFRPTNGSTDFTINGRYAIDNPGDLLDCIPAMASKRPARQARWSENLSGSVEGKFETKINPAVKHIHFSANAIQLKANWNRTVIKAKGQPAEITADFLADRSLPRSELNRLAFRIDLGSLQANSVITFPSRDTARKTIAFRSHINVFDAAWLCQQFPPLSEALGPYKPQGSLSITISSWLSQESYAGELAVDADDLRFQLPSDRPVGQQRIKYRGDALRLRLAGKLDKNVATVNAFAMDIGHSSLFVQGSIELDKGLNKHDDSYLPPGIVGANLCANVRLAFDRTNRALFAQLDELSRRYGLTGMLRLDADIKADKRHVTIKGKADATAMNLLVNRTRPCHAGSSEYDIKAPANRSVPIKQRVKREMERIFSRISKAAGERLTARFDLSIPVNLTRMKVSSFVLDTDAVRLQAAGNMVLLSAGSTDGHIALNVPELERLTVVVPNLAAYRPAGSVFIDGKFQRQNGKTSFKYVTINLDDSRGYIGNKKCRLNGSVSLQDLCFTPAESKVRLENPGKTDEPPPIIIGKFRTDALEFNIGENHGFIVGNVSNPDNAPAGRLTFLCTYINQHDLQRWIAPRSAGAETPPLGKQNSKLSPTDISELQQEADKKITWLRDRITEANLRCRIVIRRLRFFDESILTWYELNDLVGRCNIVKGTVSGEFRSGLNGGVVEQKFHVDATSSKPSVNIKSALIKVIPRKNILLQVAQEFPGNTIFGSFSQRKDVVCSLRDLIMSVLDARYRPVIVGKAKTVAIDGMLRGRAAPKWITRFFPGLNLTTYRYRKMTGFAEYLPDGTARNDMIFSGPVYDIYICGTTDIRGIAKYEIGLILLGTPQSAEFNHQLRQGRIIILKFKARIANRRFYDEEVSYPLPTETTYKIFLENNIFYRLWLAAKKNRKITSISIDSAR